MKWLSVKKAKKLKRQCMCQLIIKYFWIQTLYRLIEFVPYNSLSFSMPKQDEKGITGSGVVKEVFRHYHVDENRTKICSYHANGCSLISVTLTSSVLQFNQLFFHINIQIEYPNTSFIISKPIPCQNKVGRGIIGSGVVMTFYGNTTPKRGTVGFPYVPRLSVVMDTHATLTQYTHVYSRYDWPLSVSTCGQSRQQ